MTDRYENIRKALDVIDECADGTLLMTRDRCARLREAADTIRALLAERDALGAALEAAREDAERLDWLAEGFRTCTVYMGGDHPWTPGHKVRSLHGPSFRAAIDQARAKEDGNG